MKDAAFYPERLRKFTPWFAAEVPGFGVGVEFVEGFQVAMDSGRAFGYFSGDAGQDACGGRQRVEQ